MSDGKRQDSLSFLCRESFAVVPGMWQKAAMDGTLQKLAVLMNGSAPDIEVYLNPDPENAQFEVWIPVVKK